MSVCVCVCVSVCLSVSMPRSECSLCPSSLLISCRALGPHLVPFLIGSRPNTFRIKYLNIAALCSLELQRSALCVSSLCFRCQSRTTKWIHEDRIQVQKFRVHGPRSRTMNPLVWGPGSSPGVQGSRARDTPPLNCQEQRLRGRHCRTLKAKGLSRDTNPGVPVAQALRAGGGTSGYRPPWEDGPPGDPGAWSRGRARPAPLNNAPVVVSHTVGTNDSQWRRRTLCWLWLHLFGGTQLTILDMPQ